VKKGKRRSQKHRQRKQKVKETYAKAREDAQLCGVIPTEPVGAVRDERVPPCAQSEDVRALPALVAEAVRAGWATPEERKPGLVDDLAAILGDSTQPAKVRIAAFNALRLADKDQYERDHPEAAGKARGGGAGGAVSVNVGVAVGNVFDDIERDIKHIHGHAGASGAPTGDVSANGAPEPVAQAQADAPQAQPKTS
jgi:hypothetical protein